MEDEDDIRELLRYNLAKEGYQVTGSASGEEALKAVKAARPDLLVLDLMLPVSFIKSPMEFRSRQMNGEPGCWF